MVEAAVGERARRHATSGSVHRTLVILEVVAERGGASAREIAEVTGLPLPTVYRLARELIDGGYLVHIRERQRFELGYQLHRLGVSLHRQIGLPRQLKNEVRALHDTLQAAAYLAIHRGSQIVVVYVADSPAHPRLEPMGFGFHEAPHATAFGKILLAHLDEGQRTLHLGAAQPAGIDAGSDARRTLPALTEATITDRDELDQHLGEVAAQGIAWEFGEFQAGTTCAAAAVHDPTGLLVGSIAVSAPHAHFQHCREQTERELRAAAARLGRLSRAVQGQPAERW